MKFLLSVLFGLPASLLVLILIAVLKVESNADHWPAPAALLCLPVGAVLCATIGHALERRFAAVYPSTLTMMLLLPFLFQWMTDAGHNTLLVWAKHRLGRQHAPAATFWGRVSGRYYWERGPSLDTSRPPAYTGNQRRREH